MTLAGHNEAIHSLSFNTSDTQLVSGAADNVIKYWDVLNGKCLMTFEIKEPIGIIKKIVFSPDLDKILCSIFDKIVDN